MRTTLFSLLLVWTLIAAHPARAGMVTFVFDDGLRGVYEYAYPILRKFGMPGVTAIIVDQMESDNDDYMRVGQLLELQTAGWEIASHGLSHRRISDIPAFYTQETLSNWEEDSAAPRMVQAYTGQSQIACVLSGSARLIPEISLDDAAKNPGSFYFDRITLELHVHPPLIDESQGSNLRICSYEREMDQSRRRLEQWGFRVSSYVVPYSYLTNDVLTLGKKYFPYLATGFEGDGINHLVDPHHIVRYGIIRKSSAPDLINLVKERIKEKDAWLVFCLHDVGADVGWEPWDPRRLEEFAAWLKAHGVPVVTIKEGVALMSKRRRPKN